MGAVVDSVAGAVEAAGAVSVAGSVTGAGLGVVSALGAVLSAALGSTLWDVSSSGRCLA